MDSRERVLTDKSAEKYRWLAFVLLFALSFAVFYALMRRPASDLSIHATWAAEGDFLHPRSFVRHHAHPLWHFGHRLLLLLGFPQAAAGALTTALWKGLEFLGAYAIAKKTLDGAKPYTAALCAFCAMIVSSLCIPWVNPTVYLGAGTPNTWHNPTQIAAMAFMLLCVPMVADSYDRFARSLPAADYRMTFREWFTLTALLMLSVLAKPIFLQAFAPAACLFFLAQWIRYPKGSRYFCQMTAAALPCLPLMGLQFYFYFLNAGTGTGMAVILTGEKLADCAKSLLLMEAFPLFALCTEGRRKKGMLLTLSVLLNAVSLLEKLFFSEVGRRADDGNFGWALFGGALMLWVVMLPRFIQQFSAWKAQKKPGGGWRYWIGFPLLAYHLLSGAYYVFYLLTTGNAL